MRSSFKKISPYLITLCLIVTGVFLVGSTASATAGEWAAEIITWISQGILWALNMILILVIYALVFVASIQDFINAPAVTLGWVIVRDICNMFFVVVLLVIAFGTILNIPNYSYKKWLPKLILFAILINFSKTICGLMIDVAQVVMLTFVNAFATIGGGNIVEMLGISEIVKMADTGSATQWSVAGAYILGVIYLLVALVVMITMTMILVMRMVMIWVYTVLSPAAYLLAAFPGGQKYASQWWSEFIKNLVVGPVLAFFIWLSLAALGTSSVVTDYDQSAKQDASNIRNELAASKGSSPSALIKFIIAIGMLVGGLMVSQQIGGAAGSMAGKGMAALQKGKGLAIGAGIGAGALALKGARGSSKYLGRKLIKTTGLPDLRPSKIKETIKAFAETGRRKDEQAIRDKAQEHFEAGGLRSVVGGFGVGEDYLHRYADGFLGSKGINRARKEVFGNKKKREELGEEIDKNESSTTDLQEKKTARMDDLQETIKEQTASRLSQDKEYKSLATSGADNHRMNQLTQKKNLTAAEQEEKEKLEDKIAAQKEQRDLRESAVKEEVTKEVVGRDKEMIDIDAKIKVNEDSLNKLKAQMNEVQKPVAFEARSAYRQSVEEAKAKYKSITNADELQRAYTDAEQRGDKYDQVAILEKLSGDANLNEELKTKGYTQDAKGLHEYAYNLENSAGVKNGLKGNFSDKERTKILNDLGESEERVGHWEMAKMASVNSRGELESNIKAMRDPQTGEVMKDKNGRTMWDDSAHAVAAYAEVLKFDPQKVVNSMNRLAMGGEDADGNFQISNLGLMIFKYLASSGAYEKNSGRIMGNTAASLVSGENIKLLREVMKDEPVKAELTINLIQEKAGSGTGGGSFLAKAAFEHLKKINLHTRQQRGQAA